MQRKPGQSAYTPVARIPAGDGQTWSFDEAVAGSFYEMTAALQVNEQNTSSANAVTLTGPETITVNFENNKEYFVRYAQAQCSDCRSDQGYSGFSESVRMISGS